VPPKGWAEVREQGTFASFFRLLREERRRPVAVVTCLPRSGRPGLNLKTLAGGLEGVAGLFLLPPRATYWLTAAFGDKQLSVHSGWSRLYPAAQDWRTKPWLSPSFPPDPDGKSKVIGRLVEAALASSFATGNFEAPVTPAKGEPAQAVVKGTFSPTQVLVEVRGHGEAIMRTQYLYPGVPADRLVRPGQVFQGRWRDVALLGDFVPDHIDREAESRAKDFVGDGVVTYVFVESVSAQSIRLLLHPDVPLTLDPGNAADLSLLANQGDVVVAEVVPVDGELLASFSDAPAVPAMALLPGGPPWLEPAPARLRPEPKPEGPLSEAAPDGKSTSEVAALEEEISRLQEALEEANDKVRELQRGLRLSRRLQLPPVFRDPQQQLRFELDTSYLIQVDEADRWRYPWPAQYQLGPNFAASVDRLVAAGGISREKVIEVCVDVLCGRAKDRPVRGVKEWRTGRRGPPLVRRSDGAHAMRARLQNAAHAARRLKYWSIPGGCIELDSVLDHDEELGA
jgi:hypothetical protein